MKINSKIYYTLPKLVDPDGGPVSFTFLPPFLYAFVSYDILLNTFTFQPI